MKTTPLLEPVKAEADVFNVKPPLVNGRERFTVLPSNLGLGKDPRCAEKRSSAAALFNWKKFSAEQLTNFHPLLLMEIQYLAGCCTEWKAADGAEPEAMGGSQVAGVNSAHLSTAEEIAADPPRPADTAIIGSAKFPR